jgi:uncharacterized protein
VTGPTPAPIRTDKGEGMAVGAVQGDADTAEFFAGTERGELLLRRCGACGALSRPQARSCGQCRSAELSWAPAAGQGTVVSWSVVHGRAAGGEPLARTVVAIVELDEGPWLHSRLVDVSPDSLSGGQRVTVGFERAEGGEVIPVFRPA